MQHWIKQSSQVYNYFSIDKKILMTPPHPQPPHFPTFFAIFGEIFWSVLFFTLFPPMIVFCKNIICIQLNKIFFQLAASEVPCRSKKDQKLTLVKSLFNLCEMESERGKRTLKQIQNKKKERQGRKVILIIYLGKPNLTSRH